MHRYLSQIFLIIMGLGLVFFLTYKLTPAEKISFNQDNALNNNQLDFQKLASTLTASSLRNQSSTDFNFQELNVVSMGHSGPEYIYDPDMADSIIAVHLDLKNQNPKIYFISIPRDLWVKNPLTGNFSKINEIITDSNSSQIAYQAMTQKIGEITGLNFNKYVVFDLDNLNQVVDTLGGIKINVDQPVDDPHFKTKIPSGLQVLDGYQASIYARSRYFENGDFTRMAHQQQIIKAVLDKISSLNPVFDVDKFIQLYQIAKTVNTNLDLKTIWQLYTYLKGSGLQDIKNIVVSTDTGLISATTTPVNTPDGLLNVYILEPTAGLENYSQIQNFILNSINETISNSASSSRF